jgi:hypothetical protein
VLLYRISECSEYSLFAITAFRPDDGQSNINFWTIFLLSKWS